MRLYLITRPAHRADEAFDPDLDEVDLDLEMPEPTEPDTYEVIMAEYKRLGIA